MHLIFSLKIIEIFLKKKKKMDNESESSYQEKYEECSMELEEMKEQLQIAGEFGQKLLEENKNLKMKNEEEREIQDRNNHTIEKLNYQITELQQIIVKKKKIPFKKKQKIFFT